MADSTHVTRLFGGPGSGKTTALLDRVDEMLDEGVDVRDILVVSYTRAAATEVRERLAERLDRSPKSLRGNVCTMHAKAYELLNLSRGDVVSEDERWDLQAGCHPQTVHDDASSPWSPPQSGHRFLL